MKENRELAISAYVTYRQLGLSAQVQFAVLYYNKLGASVMVHKSLSVEREKEVNKTCLRG